MGHERGRNCQGAISRCQDVPRLHVEADAGFLFLCRLRALLRSMSLERHSEAFVTEIPEPQIALLQLSAFPRFRQARQWEFIGWKRVFGGRNLVVHDLRSV